MNRITEAIWVNNINRFNPTGIRVSNGVWNDIALTLHRPGFILFHTLKHIK